MRFYSGQTKEPSQTTIVFSDRVGWVSALLRPALVSVAGSHATAISDVCLEAPNRKKNIFFAPTGYKIFSKSRFVYLQTFCTQQALITIRYQFRHAQDLSIKSAPQHSPPIFRVYIH
jgi:hypothetical protein